VEAVDKPVEGFRNKRYSGVRGGSCGVCVRDTAQVGEQCGRRLTKGWPAKSTLRAVGNYKRPPPVFKRRAELASWRTTKSAT